LEKSLSEMHNSSNGAFDAMPDEIRSLLEKNAALAFMIGDFLCALARRRHDPVSSGCLARPSRSRVRSDLTGIQMI